jgi:GntR family transcriptional regulator
MSANPIQHRSPMYFRIQLGILEQIQAGRLHPGEQLPTEADLAQQYQVSRITAKRALDELVRQGRAFRRQGRGTFVAHARIRDISGFHSFSEDIRARGFNPSSEVLDFKEVEPEAAIRTRLHISEGEHAFLLKRLRLADQESVAIETAFLPCRLFPGLLQEDLAGGSLYILLAEKYHHVPTWADAEIEALVPTADQARLLGLKAGTPVLAAHRVTYSADYDVIESVDSVYRGDRFTFYTGRQFIGIG